MLFSHCVNAVLPVAAVVVLLAFLLVLPFYLIGHRLCLLLSYKLPFLLAFAVANCLLSSPHWSNEWQFGTYLHTDIMVSYHYCTASISPLYSLYFYIMFFFT